MIKDVMIGFPCYDNKSIVSVAMQLQAMVADPNSCVGAVQQYNGDSLVSRARNMIAKMFMDSKYKYLMFIDSDISFHPSFINKLREHNKGIVGGVYLKKKLPYEPVNSHDIGHDAQSGLSIMREIGTGFMMIRRDVFAALREMNKEDSYTPDSDQPAGDNYHDWFKVGVKNGRYLSEDYYFCQDAWDLGIPTYQDKSLLVTHHGFATYPMNDEALILGAAGLFDNYRFDCDLKEDLIRKMYLAVKKQADQRNINLNEVKNDVSEPAGN